MKITKAALLAACALAVTIGCDKGEVRPDESSEAIKEPPAKEAPVLGADTKTSIDAYMKAEVGNDSFVPIYVSARGVAVDGAPCVRFDPTTMLARAEDKKGGADSLYIEALEPSLQAASKARPLTADELRSHVTIAPGLFAEPDVPFRALVEVLYTVAQDLQPTGEDGVEDRYVTISGGGSPLKLMIRRPDGSWDGFNASTPGLMVGPDDEDAPPENNLTVAVSPLGFRVAFRGKVLPAIEGCDPAGPTVCNEGGVDTAGLISALNAAESADREAALTELVAAYDLSGLYNQLLALKALDSSETIVTVSASSEIPMAVYSAALATARSRRASPNASGTFDDDASFEAAAPAAAERPNFGGDALFPDVMVGFF